MNIKRIIREELETILGSFYLVVSDDENFIYGMNKFGGYSFEPIEKFTPKKILRSGYNTQEEANEIITWVSNSTTMGARKYAKHNPKIIPVDFIIKKREETFPIIESEEFDWIEDIDPDNIHISDLEIGMDVMANCPQNKSLSNRELTVDEIRDKLLYRTGIGRHKWSTLVKVMGICVHFKERVTICEHLGCSFKLINNRNK